jgi:hypothetical protein
MPTLFGNGTKEEMDMVDRMLEEPEGGGESKKMPMN